MMFCGKCGGRVEENGRFCAHCGNQIESFSELNHHQENQMPYVKKSAPKTKVIVPIVIAALVVIALVVYFGMIRNTDHEIVGVWREIQITLDKGGYDELTIDVDWDREKVIYTFYADGTFTFFQDFPEEWGQESGTIIGNYRIQDNKIYYYNRRSDEMTIHSEESEGEFEIVDGQLIIFYPGGQMESVFVRY